MSDILKFCRPEDVGVHPSWVEDYVNTVNRQRKMCHSFIMMRKGKIFAEGYWKPFHKERLHRMYSISKSFVSGAVGFLIDEGKLSLSDKIVDLLPEYLPKDKEVHPYIKEMTVEHLLTMATCHKVTTYAFTRENWIDTFFDPPYEPDHKAGEFFRYDTSASYTLDVIVEKITGKPFLEYLKDKALRELGFSEDAWCVEAPEGFAWGGSGVECTTRDLLIYTMLFANDGKVNGKQYLSEEYVKAATSKQIDNYSGTLSAVSGRGYGYQIWRARDNCFTFTGMGGQLGLVIPDKDMIFVCTSDTQGDEDGYHGFIDVLFDTVINKIENDSMEYDDKAFEKLENIIESLEVSFPDGSAHSPAAEKISGKTYKLEENKMGIQSVTVEFNGHMGVLTYETNRGTKRFPFGVGRYADTFIPETHYSGRRIWTPKNERYRCLNGVVWTDRDTLLMRTYVIDDYLGNMTTTLTFDEDRVELVITKTAEWFLDEYPGTAKGKAE